MLSFLFFFGTIRHVFDTIVLAFTESLYTVQAEQVSQGNVDKTVGTLLYTIAAKLKAQIAEHRGLLTQYVSQKKIASDPQLTGKIFVDDLVLIITM